jgi:hypothetical protein
MTVLYLHIVVDASITEESFISIQIYVKLEAHVYAFMIYQATMSCNHAFVFGWFLGGTGFVPI